MKKALSEQEAEEARLLRAKGYSYPEIARTYKVSSTTAETAVKRMGAYRGGRIEGEKK
jgi:DNA-directed RNA polymerase specialized sigma24 family protein